MTFMPPSTHGYLIKAELKNLFPSFYKTMQQEIKIIPIDVKNGIVSVHINDQTAIMESRKMLEIYNQNLEERVKQETIKRLDTERALIQQAKMALMGDMIGAIAHQWRQPLNALGLYIQKDALLEVKPADMFINISVVNNGDYVEIVFEDSAGGIKDDIMERVFEPYFTTKEQGKGTGIGLYMSRQIIKRHLHGELSVTNGKHGARFFIQLPIFSK